MHRACFIKENNQAAIPYSYLSTDTNIDIIRINFRGDEIIHMIVT